MEENFESLPSDIKWIFEEGNLCDYPTGILCPSRLKALIRHLELEGKLYQYKCEKLI